MFFWLHFIKRQLIHPFPVFRLSHIIGLHVDKMGVLRAAVLIKIWILDYFNQAQSGMLDNSIVSNV